ncbi:hypothetical protein BASA81_003755 [Batrachochytrium salamandrivorans]|nr:hypothetical protein BASA81_003755 [Batrachochytrium salamandrivorans]
MDKTYAGFATSQAVMLSLICVVLVVEVWGFAEYLHSRKKESQVMRRLRWCLFLNIAFLAATEAIVLAAATLVGVPPEVCSAMAKSIAASYICGTCAAYLFLLQRVKLVSRFSQDRVFNRLYWLMETGLIMGIPVCVSVYAWIADGEVSPGLGEEGGGRCRQVLPLWVFWSFSILNLVISTALIYLFASPLRRMMNTGLSAMQVDLRRVYWRNLVIGSVAVLFTSIAVLTYGVLQYFAEQNNTPELSVVGLGVMSWDAFVLAMCCRATTLVWLPAKIRQLIAPTVDSGEEAEGADVEVQPPEENRLADS